VNAPFFSSLPTATTAEVSEFEEEQIQITFSFGLVLFFVHPCKRPKPLLLLFPHFHLLLFLLFFLVCVRRFSLPDFAFREMASETTRTFLNFLQGLPVDEQQKTLASMVEMLSLSQRETLVDLLEMDRRMIKNKRKKSLGKSWRVLMFNPKPAPPPVPPVATPEPPPKEIPNTPVLDDSIVESIAAVRSKLELNEAQVAHIISKVLKWLKEHQKEITSPIAIRAKNIFLKSNNDLKFGMWSLFQK
jgi:hypothetical protein